MNAGQYIVAACEKLARQEMNGSSRPRAQARSLEILDRSLPPATVGESYGHQLTASGSEPPYTWSVQSGSLPDGLSLSAGGTIGGKATTEGTSDFRVQVTDAQSATASQFLSLTVQAAGSESEQARGFFTGRHLIAACEKLRAGMLSR